MSRSRSSATSDSEGNGVSLFPFLAVLLCTMGALLVILVVLSHQANQRRHQEAMRLAVETTTAMAADDSRLADDMSELDELWRRIGEQDRLLDAAMRRNEELHLQWARPVRVVSDAENGENGPSDDSRELAARQTELDEHLTSRRAELDAMRKKMEADAAAVGVVRERMLESETTRRVLLGQIETEQRDIAALRAQLVDKESAILSRSDGNAGHSISAERIASTAESIDSVKPVWSIIPYAGHGGVRREPVYLECRREGIVLQPEGICFTRDDFRGNLSRNDHPLVLAVRMAGESIGHLSETPGTSPPKPYLLLLVRPDGISSYYVARTTLEAYPAEVGYELVGMDWELAYPEPDAALTNRILVAVSAVREKLRKEQLIAAIETAGVPLTGDAARQMISSVEGGVGGDGSGNGGRIGAGTGNGSFAVAGTENGGGPGMENGGASGLAVGVTGSGVRVIGGNTPGDVIGVSGTSAAGGVGWESGANGMLGEAGTGVGARTGSMVGNGGGIVNGEDYAAGSGGAGEFDSLVFGKEMAAGRAASGETASGSGSGGGYADGAEYAKNGVMGGAVGGDSMVGATSGTAGAAQSAAPSGTAGAATGSGASGGSVDGGATSGTPSFLASLASSRGKNWGLPDAVQTMAPVLRPIPVVLTAEKLTLPRNSQTRKIPEISLTGSTSRAMDELVAAVWDHQKTWGFAGRQMYWKPTLSVEVSPDAEAKFAEICALLTDSGIDVHRKGK